jgi:hypothetical protein
MKTFVGRQAEYSSRYIQKRKKDSQNAIKKDNSIQVGCGGLFFMGVFVQGINL